MCELQSQSRDASTTTPSRASLAGHHSRGTMERKHQIEAVESQIAESVERVKAIQEHRKDLRTHLARLKREAAEDDSLLARCLGALAGKPEGIRVAGLAVTIGEDEAEVRGALRSASQARRPLVVRLAGDHYRVP